MNPTEAAQLLTHAAAFDNRKPSTGAALAWAAALKDVPLDADAIAAIARYYGQAGDDPNERRWLQPHHVRHHRQAIRNERVELVNPLYDGDPDETPEQAIENLRALLADAASGRLPTQPVRLALEPGYTPAEPGTRMKAMVEAGAKAVALPSRRAGVVNVLGVVCPHCSAPVGSSCVSGRKRQRKHADAHPSRLDAARRQASELDDAS